MSAPVRFLSVALLAWVAVRATTLGALPGFTVSHAKPVPPAPIIATDLQSPIAATAAAEFDPAVDWAPQADYAQAQLAYPRLPARPIQYYHGAYSPMQAAYRPATIAPRPAWSLASLTGSDVTFVPADAAYSELPPSIQLPGMVQRSTPVPQAASAPATPKLDRWQMSTWALLRGPPAPGALANAGTLGGSQAGARVTYAFNRSLSASVRTTSPIGGSRGAEIAAGIRWIPLRSLPVALTVERRQSISPHGGGRSDFALFTEGGVYKKPMPWRFELDGYMQAGVVGLTRRDLFVDGSVAFTRPVYKRFSAGLGLWGGYQPGLYRIDAGPRLSMRVRDNISAHVDWRQRVVGNAVPASGPTLTLAADF